MKTENASRILKTMQLTPPSGPLLKIPKPTKITPISHYLSGEAAFQALKKAVEDLAQAAPLEHDVIIEAFGVRITQVRYMQPHTLVFEGCDPDANKTTVVAHFSQLVAHVRYVPKVGCQRVITGFSKA
jgi:hypothetical protein